MYLIERTGILADHGHDGDSHTTSVDKRGSQGRHVTGSKTSLVVLTAAGVAGVCAASGSNTVLSLGLSYASGTALALRMVEAARQEATSHDTRNGGSVIYSANGFLAQPDRPATSGEELAITVARDVAVAAAVGTGIATVALESFSFGGLAYWGLLGQAMGERWVFGQAVLSVVYGVGMVMVHVGVYGGMLVMVSVEHFATLGIGQTVLCFTRRDP